jgi:hypothetical protein
LKSSCEAEEKRRWNFLFFHILLGSTVITPVADISMAVELIGVKKINKWEKTHFLFLAEEEKNYVVYNQIFCFKNWTVLPEISIFQLLSRKGLIYFKNRPQN